MNINLANSGQAEILLAPEKQEMPFLTASGVEYDGASMIIADIDNTPGAVLVVSATAPQSAGTNFLEANTVKLVFTLVLPLSRQTYLMTMSLSSGLLL